MGYYFFIFYNFMLVPLYLEWKTTVWNLVLHLWDQQFYLRGFYYIISHVYHKRVHNSICQPAVSTTWSQLHKELRSISSFTISVRKSGSKNWLKCHMHVLNEYAAPNAMKTCDRRGMCQLPHFPEYATTNLLHKKPALLWIIMAIAFHICTTKKVCLITVTILLVAVLPIYYLYWV